jgi:hypothetical protein
MAVLLLISCSKNTENKAEVNLHEPWAMFTQYQWAHDGNSVSTEHFKIFSDSASMIERNKISKGLELILDGLTKKLEINSSSAEWYPNKENPFTIYLNRTHEEVPFAHAFPRGMIIVSPDAEFFQVTKKGQYGKIIAHELTHSIDLAITMDSPSQPPTWFREGLAQLCSGLSGENELLTIADLNQSIINLGLDKNKWTPLSIRKYTDYPGNLIHNKQEGLYYPLFELAVKYLFSKENTGKNLANLIPFLESLSVFNSFNEEFKNTFGFSLEKYEEEFYSIIEEWLGK